MSLHKALGQNFLVSQGTIAKIIHSFIEHPGFSKSESILEIGPGRGALTYELLKLDKLLVLSELDRTYAQDWRQKGLKVLEGDFVKLPITEWKSPSPISVISNLPYNASTAILDRLHGSESEITHMVLMFQAEVAERIMSPPGTRNSSALALDIQNQWGIEKILRVGPSAFSPQPKIDSIVLRLTRLESSRLPAHLGRDFRAFAQTCFRHRRKTLKSNLPRGFKFPGELGQKRAEQLGWEEWCSLLECWLAQGYH